jgi:hypothetical protein
MDQDFVSNGDTGNGETEEVGEDNVKQRLSKRTRRPNVLVTGPMWAK